MTRPGIVRADTIDLQTQRSPSAQDHSRKPQGNAIGPHQVSELRHVQEERHSEEENLSSAWNSAGNGLSDEPPSDDELLMRDEQSMQQNGKPSERHDDSDMGDSGDDSMDDDMMEKMSSSPSISDGGYSHSVTPKWPKRNSSLQTPTPLRKSAIQRPEKAPEDTDSANSSPFVATPAHLPISLSIPRSASPFPFHSSLTRMRCRPTTPVAEAGSDSSSPFIESPKHLPLHFHHSSNKVQPASHHHRQVRTPEAIGEEYEMGEYEDEGYEEDDVGRGIGVRRPTILVDDIELDTKEMEGVYRQPGPIKSASDIELEKELLPIDDPLLKDDVFSDSPIADAGERLAGEEDDDWETESDTDYSQDSFSSAGYNSDDDTNELELPADDRFIDSGWGGECLRETEDIDFEFVYALHTFVATVEGQANAQKGDTMVLLDDSNSYWWLVRVVKDSTIGYLPAEHIETPTERLARLNKHRNVDLSQTMLGDTTEKSKNPLKKAMRRRNAKTVTFSAPTYVEPSEYEYSTDEDSGDDASLTAGSNSVQEQAKEQTSDSAEKDEISSVQPLSVKQVKRDTSPEKEAASDEKSDDRRRTIDESRTSDEDLDGEFSGQSKSRNGTVRNTDSFFRDESIETRKITLTPNILRDENGPAFVTVAKTSLDRGPSLELLEKDSKDRGKGDKKKEKKAGGGMLSSIFKRGNKKAKGDDAGSVRGKLSGETLRESPTSEENSPIERPSTSDSGPLQRSGSKGKLQKSPPNGNSPTGGMSPAPLSTQKKQNSEPTSNASSTQSTPRSASPVEPLAKKSSLRSTEAGAGVLTGISNKLRHSPSQSDEAKPTKVKRAKTREALDVDSSPEDETRDPFADAESIVKGGNKLSAPPGPEKLGAMSSTERLSESPVHITTADAMPDNEPPALVGDSSSASSADELTSLRSSPSPPMTAAEAANARSLGGLNFGQQSSNPGPLSPSQPAPLSIQKQAPLPPSRTPPPQPGTLPATAQRSLSPTRNNSTSTTASTLSPAWSDAHLRAYMDDSSDIKDLLLVVHDTSGVLPVGTDHPLMSNLYAEEKGKVKEMDSALDRLLGQWLAKRRGGSVVHGRKGSTPTPGGGISARSAGA